MTPPEMAMNAPTRPMLASLHTNVTHLGGHGYGAGSASSTAPAFMAWTPANATPAPPPAENGMAHSPMVAVSAPPAMTKNPERPMVAAL